MVSGYSPPSNVARVLKGDSASIMPIGIESVVGFLYFPSPQKPTSPNSHLIRRQRFTGLKVVRLLSATPVEKSQFLYSLIENKFWSENMYLFRALVCKGDTYFGVKMGRISRGGSHPPTNFF